MTTRQLWLLLTAVLLAASAKLAFAGVDQWTLIGPDGGGVTALDFDPGHAGTLYLMAGGNGRDAGLFRSLDAGETWFYLDRSGFFTGELIDSVVVDPRDSCTLYAHARLSDIQRSTDCGRTWTLVLADAAYSFALDPLDSRTLYALTHDYSLSRSVDAGATWQLLADFIPYNLPGTSGGGTGWSILVAPTEPRTIYIGYSYGTLRSQDGGHGWEVVGPENLTAYAFGALDPRVIFARLTYGLCGARSEDGAATFVKIPDPPGTYCTAFAFDPRAPRRLYAATGADLSRVLLTEDDGATWEDRSQGLPRQFIAAFLEVDPTDSNRLYLGTYEDGLFASRDGGLTWQPAVRGFSSRTIHSLAAVGDPPLLFATGYDLLRRSADYGKTWSIVGSTTHPEDVFMPARILQAPGRSQRLYAADGRGVWTSDDRGVSWSKLSESAPTRLASLAIDPRHPRILYAGGADGIAKTTDGGASWTASNEGLIFPEPCDAIYCSDPTVTLLLVDPERAATVYAIWDLTLYVTRNAGATWTPIAAVPPAVTTALALDGDGVLYAGGCDGVFRSDDAGLTWQPAGTGGASADPPICITQLAASPGRPSTLAAGTQGGGVFQTLDGGATWTRLEPGIPARYVGALTYDPSTPTRLYAGTEGAGVITFNLANAPTATLAEGRFQLAAAWRNNGASGPALPSIFSRQAATFSYFSPEQPDLAVKLLDGTGVNGHTWWFGGSLSNAEAEITITDLATNETRDYFLPAGGPTSAADVVAFATPPWLSGDAPSDSVAAGELRLLGGRFRVETEWRDPSGVSSPASAVALDDGSGAFVFFAPENPEVVVKLIDGRALNGRFWLFAGGLSSLEYRITVTDLETGASRQFMKPAGELASFADTSAF